jgi:hypothetical protein
MRAETENTEVRELNEIELEAIVGGGFDLGGIVGSVLGSTFGGPVGGLIGSEIGDEGGTVVKGTCHK